jgi:murein DD-endopeptidase MepM/ murein hydrolase activator NlpD
MPYDPQVFPLRVPPDFVATRVVRRSNGTPCPNNPGGYRAGGQTWPSERPILYDAFDENRGGTPHRALDITCADGTPVVSPVDGRVKVSWRYQGETFPGAGTSPRGGNYVWIDGADGFTHYFAHMRDVRVVSGQRVVAGQMIGRCSDTGSARGSCPHLHYAVNQRNGTKINPYHRVRELYETQGWRGTPTDWLDEIGPPVVAGRPPPPLRERDDTSWAPLLVVGLAGVGYLWWRSRRG